MTQRILISTGGSGGHVVPAIILHDHLKDQFNAIGKQVLSRSFNNQEQILLAKLLREHIEEFESNPSEADKLVSIGLTPVPSEIQKVELAAWISVARAVLNLHETITRN